MAVSACSLPQRTQSEYKEERLAHESLNAVEHVHHVEVQQQPDTNPAQLQIGQQLGLVDWQDSLHRFDFHENFLLDTQIYAVRGIDLESVVSDRQRDLGLDAETGLLKIVGKTTMVRTFKLPFLCVLCGKGLAAQRLRECR